MKSPKDFYIDAYDDLYAVAIDDGMTEEEAQEHAEANASEQAQDMMDDYGDYLYEQEKDRRMERNSEDA